MNLPTNAVADPGARKRVLVVDDSFIMRNMVKQIVESDPDLEVVDTAENGRIALSKVRQFKPDVVLLDIEMPEMSGLETLRRLGLRSACKVVILSNFIGNGDSAEEMEALRLGAVATIAKPSGSVSLDLKQMRESKIVNVLRKTLGLPSVTDAMRDASEDQPLRFLESVDFSIGRLGNSLLDGLETGVLVFDPGGALVRANPAARRILRGWDLTPNASTVGSLCDEFNPSLGQEIRDAIGGGETSVPAEVNISKPDGDSIAARRVVRPIMVAGKPCGALVLLDDIAHRNRLQSLLERTIPAAGDKVVIDASEFALAAATREVTVLFANIRGFAPLAETLGARRAVDLLNEYFSYMVDVIGDEDGMIDKFAGDAMMVLFGVPRSRGNDADGAVAAARRMHRALKLMNELGSGPALRIGIGIGSGPAIAGQVGFPGRMNYTVIGEPANLATRIERVTKAYGSDILICDETFRRLSRPIPARKVDVVILPGRDTATTIYEVLVDDPGATAAEWLGAFNAGVSAYLAGDFIDANTHLTHARSLNPDDMMAVVLAQRCRRLAARGADEWTGAWKLAER